MTTPRAYAVRVGDRGKDLAGGDVMRYAVALFACLATGVAVTSDPAAATHVAAAVSACALVCVVALAPDLPAVWSAVLLVLALVLVVLAKGDGGLDVALFLVSLVAILAGGWPRPVVHTVVVGALAVATPMVVEVRNPGDIDLGVWLLGIGGPFVLALGFRRQEVLGAELADANLRLADQALARERRLIARDVHDLVGHGLAGVLVQLAHARHVLARGEIRTADEALGMAEVVGRQSLDELRRTVAMLRSDPDDIDSVVPRVTDLPALVEQTRARGVDVTHRCVGDLRSVPPVVGLTLYRIAQESLLNAARHAPAAPVDLVVEVTGSEARLQVRSIGVADPVGGGHRPGGYGLVGMRERAEVLGGSLVAGRDGADWTVCAGVPLRRGSDAVLSHEERPRG